MDDDIKERELFLNLIIKETRVQVKSTHFKINQEICSTIFDEEKSSFGRKSIDLSLIPNLRYKDEFLLWLAGFIEHITIDEAKESASSFSHLLR